MAIIRSPGCTTQATVDCKTAAVEIADAALWLGWLYPDPGEITRLTSLTI